MPATYSHGRSHNYGSYSPVALETVAAHTAPHTHRERLIECRQSMGHACPLMSTSMDLLTAETYGHCQWLQIGMYRLRIRTSLRRVCPLSQHATSTNLLTFGPGPAVATGIAFPPRDSLVSHMPLELSISIPTYVDPVLEVVLVAHVVCQSSAAVDGPCVVSPTKMILQANAAVVVVLMVLNNPVSARGADSVPQLFLPSIPHPATIGLTSKADEWLVANARSIGMCVHVVDWMVVW